MATDTDSSHVSSLLDALSRNLDATSAALQPLLSRPVSSTAGKLPLLDKAKLYIHVAYAIESLLFSQLQVAGVDAKSHPIFAELKRVRAYFEKIKHAEGEGGPAMRLDKGAAGRMIKAGLAGNDQGGQKRKADELAERYGKGNRFGAVSKRMKEDEASLREEKIGGTDDATLGDKAVSTQRHISSEKKRHRESESAATSGQDDAASTSTTRDSQKRKKKHSHAPNDAHQAFHKLLGKSKDSAQNSSTDSGKEKKKKHRG